MDSARWHKAKKAKPDAAAKLKATNSMTEFEERESVFEEHRDELTAEFKYAVSHFFFLTVYFEKFRSKTSIPNISKGFWKDYRHLANHFSHLTISPPLTGIVEQNITVQLGSF